MREVLLKEGGMKPKTGWSDTVQAPAGKDCPSDLGREHV